MANYNVLKTAIQNAIKANGNNAITGPVLQSELISMVNVLGAGYQYFGVAQPSTNPGNPDSKCFFVAYTPGTYVNFDGIIVTGLCILKYDTVWRKEDINISSGGGSVVTFESLPNGTTVILVDGTPMAIIPSQYALLKLSAFTTTPSDVANGAFYYNTSDKKIYQRRDLSTAVIPYYDGAIYTYNNALYVWNGTDLVNVSDGGGGADFSTEPDDLTLETVGDSSLLKFANRQYNSLTPNGLGFKILRGDSTFAQQVTDTNTIYEIRYDFNLGGANVAIPSGCVLRFNGGSISNGSIVYNNTEIQGEPRIACVCTGSLRNLIVTPQMYGAKGDGITDDKVAFNNAVLYNNTVFVPSGTYIVSEPVQLKSNNTLFGTGKESKIINPTVTGYEKMCVWAGGLAVGSNSGSFLEIPTLACTIAADRMNVLLSDTSGFSVGDIVYICKDEAYTTKNPLYSWTAKVVAIVANTSLQLDGYIDPDYLDGVQCLIRNLANLPVSSAYLGNKILENVSVHDLSLINSEDSGSGMYVVGVGVYKGSFQNLFLRGNTCFGGNFAINVSIDNIVAEYDGGFIDMPEINQFVEVSNCRAIRYGARQNTIGVTFLMGYKCYFHDNIINDGNVGKLGFQQHLYPIIRNNTLMNFNPGTGRAVELSVHGNSILQNNYISSNGTNPIVDARGTGNIITENYIVNPNVIRWLQGYTVFDYSNNRVERNYTTNLSRSDASFMNQLVNTVIRTDVPQINGSGTISVAADSDYAIFNNANNLNNPRLAKLTLLIELGDYTITLTGANNATKTITLTQVTKLELYIIVGSNYIRYYTDGANGGAKTTTFNNHGAISKIVLHNTGAEAKQLYLTLYEAAVS